MRKKKFNYLINEYFSWLYIDKLKQFLSLYGVDLHCYKKKNKYYITYNFRGKKELKEDINLLEFYNYDSFMMLNNFNDKDFLEALKFKLQCL